MLYFTSDIHFNDIDTLTNDNRPFKSPKQFDKHIIRTWNKQTKKGDTIFVIGDFVDCNGENHDTWKKSIKYVKKIKANVVLILGNNEERVVKHYFSNNFENFRNYCLNLGFKEVYENLTIDLFGIQFYLTHKPKNHKDTSLNLFGHSHRAMGIYKPFGFNIGCDLNHFKLYSENDIKHLLSMKEKYWDKDTNLNI